MCAAAGIAAAIAAYLAWSKVADSPTICGPLAGCATVASSPWSEVFGIPVAVFGTAASTLTLGASALWWRRADRRALLAAYVLGLASLPVLAWLVWLELFVIGAVCDWCVAYALAVIVGWAFTASALMRTGSRTAAGDLEVRRGPRPGVDRP
jgi:uncharacterized membrane protein